MKFFSQYEDWTSPLSVKHSIIQMSTTRPLNGFNPFEVNLNDFSAHFRSYFEHKYRALFFNCSTFWGLFALTQSFSYPHIKNSKGLRLYASRALHVDTAESPFLYWNQITFNLRCQMFGFYHHFKISKYYKI